MFSQPHIPVENVDVVRRKQAFGRWALPKIYKDLHKKDDIVVLQAISSICDLMHDPEKIYEAMRLKFVKRLAGLLDGHENVAVQERILIALQTIASHAVGREEMLKHQNLLDKLKVLLNNDSTEIRFKTAAVIENLARSFTAACVLIRQDYIQSLLECVTKDEKRTVMLHLQSLEILFVHTSGQVLALAYNGLEKMVSLLQQNDFDIIPLACNCLALLVSLPEGKQMSVERDLLVKLNELLHLKNSDIYTAAAQVIMFATHTVKSKHRAATVPGLAKRLLHLANDFNNPPVQMFAMKALGNMCEHPTLRKEFEKKHLNDVYEIKTHGMEELTQYKEILIKIISWKPWIG
ncbi:hypothetical protein CBL_01299 [Carabus blaptoides fortunei]